MRALRAKRILLFSYHNYSIQCFILIYFLLHSYLALFSLLLLLLLLCLLSIVSIELVLNPRWGVFIYLTLMFCFVNSLCCSISVFFFKCWIICCWRFIFFPYFISFILDLHRGSNVLLLLVHVYDSLFFSHFHFPPLRIPLGFPAFASSSYSI